MTLLLDIRGLTTVIPTRKGPLTVVDDLTFTLESGQCLGLVGESGCGKSMACRSLLGLVPVADSTTTGQALYKGNDLAKLSETALTKIRGREIAMMVQDAVSALNPVWRIGDQITEAMLAHGITRTRVEARSRAVALMRQVGIPDPENRLDDYPHQFSGGMCQRVVIAAALACDPQLIIADEPTTALDVTVQDQILKLLIALQRDLGLGLLLVTHDMGVVAQSCQRVAVMYAGQIVELADTPDLFTAPRHPYTQGLLDCIPRLDTAEDSPRLTPITGMPPDLADLPRGCRFHPRCPIATEACGEGPIPLRETAPGRLSRCLRAEDMAALTLARASA